VSTGILSTAVLYGLEIDNGFYAGAAAGHGKGRVAAQLYLLIGSLILKMVGTE
jgi:hypothetical protein